MGKAAETKESLVLPGDIIANSEEYVPGKNAMESNGNIVSLVFGKVSKDDDSLVISVIPPKRKMTLHTNQVVYGQVVKMDQRKASIRVGAVFDKELGLVQYTADGSVGLSTQYSRNAEPSMRVGDIIRAKVLRSGSRGLDLGIFGKNLGVLRTLCSKCRTPLVRKNSALYCDNCEKSEIRKVAEDYGAINVMEEIA